MDEPPVQRSSADLRVRLGGFANPGCDAMTVAGRLGRDGGGLSRLGSESRFLEKTAHRCHICGGKIVSKWQADHVLAHSSGGDHSAENYLPAHVLCNNYRWDYGSEEFQWILKIVVWARTQMEQKTGCGNAILTGFAAHDSKRHDRRQSS